MQALKESGDISREDVRALRERHRKAFTGVLTGEQRAQLEARKAEWQARKDERRWVGRGGALMRLELGDDQQAQLQALRRRHRQQMEKSKASGDVAREQVRALREQYREAFQAVLTEEQRAQLDELRAERESQGELRGRFGRRGWKGRRRTGDGNRPEFPSR